MERYTDTWIASDWFRYNNADPISPPREARFYVLYDDAQRAIKEAEQRGCQHGTVIGSVSLGEIGEANWQAYLNGQRDERARIRAGVVALRPWEYPDFSSINYDRVLAVIDGTAPQGGEP